MTRTWQQSLLWSVALGSVVCVSATASATNFLMQRLSGGAAGTSHMLYGTAGGDWETDDAPGPTESISSDYAGHVSDSGPDGSNVDVLSQETANLYTAVGSYSGAPQANAATIITAHAFAQPGGYSHVESDDSAEASALYEVDECPDDTGLLICDLSVIATAPDDYPWTTHASAYARAGSSWISVSTGDGSFHFTGSVAHADEPNEEIDEVDTGTAYESAPIIGSEYVGCGAQVGIEVSGDGSAFDWVEDSGDVIVSSSAHADFEVVTF